MGSRRYDIGIIGSGIIGLATAMTLSQEHPRSKIVVEKESRIAQHQTGHNSGVIHAGIYYAPGSQKANFCSTGGAMLRRFRDRNEVPYEMCGKLIVAIDESEVPMLEELYRRGSANGAEGLEIVGQERLREIEPHAAGVQADKIDRCSSASKSAATCSATLIVSLCRWTSADVGASYGSSMPVNPLISPARAFL